MNTTPLIREPLAGIDSRPLRPPPPAAAPGTSWAARFGRVILEHGLATIPAALFHYQSALYLSAQDVWFVCYLLARRWKAELPYPSLKQVEQQTGVQKRTLQYLRVALEAQGYLQILPQYDLSSRRQTANQYDLTGLFTALERLLATEQSPENSIRDEAQPPGLEDVSDTSFVARYGRVIARAGIATVPLALFTYQGALGLSPQQVWFVAYILAHKWTAALPYPSLKKMATRTGYSERMLHYVKAELIAAGYLRLVPRHADTGAQEANAYDFGPLLDEIAHRVQPEVPLPDVSLPPEPLARPPGGQHLSRAARIAASRDLLQPVAAVSAPAPGLHVVLPAPGDAEEPHGGRAGSSPPAAPVSSYLALLIQDLSREFGDTAHERSNVTQAHRLWARLWAVSAMSDTTFGTDVIQEARQRTRQAQGAQGSGQITNKMAYFFEVLRDLVEVRLQTSETEVAHG